MKSVLYVEKNVCFFWGGEIKISETSKGSWEILEIWTFFLYVEKRPRLMYQKGALGFSQRFVSNAKGLSEEFGNFSTNTQPIWLCLGHSGQMWLFLAKRRNYWVFTRGWVATQTQTIFRNFLIPIFLGKFDPIWRLRIFFTWVETQPPSWKVPPPEMVQLFGNLELFVRYFENNPTRSSC